MHREVVIILCHCRISVVLAVAGIVVTAAQLSSEVDALFCLWFLFISIFYSSSPDSTALDARIWTNFTHWCEWLVRRTSQISCLQLKRRSWLWLDEATKYVRQVQRKIYITIQFMTQNLKRSTSTRFTSGAVIISAGWICILIHINEVLWDTECRVSWLTTIECRHVRGSYFVER